MEIKKYLFIFFLFKIFLVEKLYFTYPKISILIPLYNKSKYLKRSIGSIQKQTLKDIEIILINDGSEDNSLEILKEMVRNDSRIKIFNNEQNRGGLYSRARGILNSKGEYIMELDADDELEGVDNLEYLYKKAYMSKVDIISFSFLFKVKNENNINKINTKINLCSNFGRIVFQPEIFINANEFKDYLIWNKLVKREIFIKAVKQYKKIICKEKVSYADDEIWSMLINKYAKSMACVNKLIYIYYENNDSLMGKLNETIYLNNLIFWNEMFKVILNEKKHQKYLIRHISRLIDKISIKIYLNTIKNDLKLRKEYINILTKFKNYNYIYLNLKINILLEKIKKNKN